MGKNDNACAVLDFKAQKIHTQVPAEASGTVFYEPQDNRHEAGMRAYLEACWPKYYGKDKKL